MEAIGVLAGGIAHDFNNLLMGIMGTTSLILLHTPSQHPDYQKLKNIEQYVQSGTELTRQLLGFARGGKYEVKPTNLNELISNQIHMFARTRKEITIHEKYDKNLWIVDVDRGQIEQSLLNLYINAWQAMPKGGDLYVKTENIVLDENFIKLFTFTPGNYAKISVTDTGVGMDETTRQRIFEPFFSTKEMGRGTGLGLASVYGIIKNHGGIIDVFSEKGKGTTFTIYLPAARVENPVPEMDDKKDGEIQMGTETILLIDDEAIILDVGKQMLEKLGYRVIIANSGREGLEIYKTKRNEIDLIILDMIMPGMGGNEVYKQLQILNPTLKVLLSSGYSLDGLARDILNQGCNGFIQKPFQLKQLSQKIRKILA
jgi:CheY-like chemotaxis protein